jgi:hypothetical protein
MFVTAAALVVFSRRAARQLVTCDTGVVFCYWALLVVAGHVGTNADCAERAAAFPVQVCLSCAMVRLLGVHLHNQGLVW